MSYKNNENNSGKRWSKEEINDLKIELKNKIPYDKIAENHKRSERAIKLYGLNLANKIFQEDKKDEIDNILGFSLNDIKNYNEFKETEKIRNKEKKKKVNEKKKNEHIDNKELLLKKDYSHKLNYEQQQYFNKIIETKESIFLTGSPGTGKSFTLRKLIEYFKENNFNIGVTSTTGCSALLIGARTLHSFLKLSVNKTTAEDLFKNIKKYPENMKKIKNLDILIIEEISMLSDKLFNLISKYLSLICNNDKPFGGIRLLLVGDFCQLPPVEDDFCFLSKEWNRLNPLIMNLKKLLRQGTDTRFQELLNRARTGYITDEDINILKQCVKKENIEYTCLCSTNKEATIINNGKLKELIDNGIQTIKYRINNSEYLEICKGCKVMVNWNIDIENHIVNGTTGIVDKLDLDYVIIKITNSNRFYKVKYINIKDEITGNIIQTIMPLQLAWATTIHKSQGATIDYLLTD